MSACCDAARDELAEFANDRLAPTRTRRVREICAWILPSAILVFVPKCPACLAAHMTLWTGLGLSISTATHLRWVLLLVCVAALLFLIVKRLGRITAIFRTTENMNSTAARLSARAEAKNAEIAKSIL